MGHATEPDSKRRRVPDSYSTIRVCVLEIWEGKGESIPEDTAQPVLNTTQEGYPPSKRIFGRSVSYIGSLSPQREREVAVRPT